MQDLKLESGNRSRSCKSKSLYRDHILRKGFSNERVGIHVCACRLGLRAVIWL
ncbi:hypothetical protein HETIRDRAFT_408697 [Heterobasidion irregulare TC 32-1]|uniref:Uncharacterized protein n=1 Tax=Heterobasidion irregulare (strain TC 32-1) TaxID=747525 RepID=W4KHK0_HETIT|nr:uncharacterized protein HETIRDRAFT_408697 [Heterobasidion irregulare TC 32-1]ETW84775.1 hypothetical protein HETIRDRAFT_408697 [Heterobasidion irregulare TC 32-1]